MHSFTTERLLISPLNEQDKNLYVSLYTDVKIMRNIGEPLSTKAAEQAFGRVIKIMTKENPTVITWAITLLDTQECIGIQALNWQNSDVPEIGIMLLRHGNGKLIPEEAMGALMEYSFRYLSINTINGEFAKKNLATKRFLKKLGFIPEIAPIKALEHPDKCFEYFNKAQWHQKLIVDILP